jgi:hypothetical protein
VAVADAAAPAVAPQLLGLVREALDREDDPMGIWALSIAGYLLGDRGVRLLEEARLTAVPEDALADQVDVLDALIAGREPPEHAPALAEYLFDAAAIGSE